MAREKLRNFNPKEVRDTLNKAIQISDTWKTCELDLIHELKKIDHNRFFVRYGYCSLSGFCMNGLGLSRFHTQRIVTRVRKEDQNRDSIMRMVITM